jgi:hypothetical protein
MVRELLGLPVKSRRRVSWANSDIVLADGTRIGIKAIALWQSWKFVNEDGSSKCVTEACQLLPTKVRFSGLRGLQAVDPVKAGEQRGFKSGFYVFCFQTETDPNTWNA